MLRIAATALGVALALALGACATSSAATGAAPERVSASSALLVGDDACTTDADCVPADCCGCCPRAACVSLAEHGTSCPDVICEDMCPGGLGCGGACVCHAGHCATR